MRKYLFLSFIIAGVGGLASCNDGQNPAADAAQAEDAVVDVPVNPAGNEPVSVTAGQTLKGAFVAPRAGNVDSLSVVIGNNLNTSDGKLDVKLCQTGVCVDGSAELAGSNDNSYLKIPLSNPLTVNSSEPVEFSLTKEGGSVPVAVYLFAAQEGSGATTNDLTSGAATPRLPQFGLGYSQ